MAFDVINNGEDGLVVRGKLNDNFNNAVETTDTRLGSVGYGDLDLAADLAGPEFVAISQSGVGVKTTVDEIAGNPLTIQRSHGRNRQEGYTDFGKTTPAQSIANGAICGLEEWYANFGGAGASVLSTNFLGITALALGTGTTTTGNANITNMRYVKYSSSLDMDCRNFFALSALPSTEAYTSQIGYILGSPALATVGQYFECDNGSANWFACKKNAGGTTRIDTGVAVVIGNSPVMRIYQDISESATKYYINDMDTPVATIPLATRPITDGTLLQMVFSIRKSAGTTSTTLSAFIHTYNNETTPLVGF